MVLPTRRSTHIQQPKPKAKIKEQPASPSAINPTTVEKLDMSNFLDNMEMMEKESGVQPSSPNSVEKLKSANCYHDEEEEFIFESEVSIDEIIQRKIKKAEERGEVIELEL